MTTETLAPIPTPIDVEAVLVGLRDGSNAHARWVKLDQAAERAGGTDEDHLEDQELGRALWIAETVDPTSLAGMYWGLGETAVEAAAVAWVGACLDWESWYLLPLSDEDCRSVPREVAPGWNFLLRPNGPPRTASECKGMN